MNTDALNMLLWLQKHGYVIGVWHSHSQACRDQKGKIVCGYSNGELQPSKKTPDEFVTLFEKG